MQHISLVEVTQCIYNLNRCPQYSIDIWRPCQNGQGLGLPEPALLNALLQGILRSIDINGGPARMAKAWGFLNQPCEDDQGLGLSEPALLNSLLQCMLTLAFYTTCKKFPTQDTMYA